MKYTVEIEDVLEDQKDAVLDGVETEFRNYLAENTPDRCPDWEDLDYSGALHEIIDGAVPVYTHQVEAAWFLYGRELEAAYEDAGIGSNPRENDGMTAIFCWLEQAAQNWFRDHAEDIFDAWRKEHDKKEAAE